MSYPIYSERFLIGFGDAGSYTYTIPGAKRAVLKNLTAFNGGASTNIVSLQVAGRLCWAQSVPGANGAVSVSVFVVCYQGDVVVIRTFGNSMGYTLSGFLFDDPSGAHGPPGGFTYNEFGDRLPEVAPQL